MTNREFIYWLEGFSVLSDDEHIDQRQLQIIFNHANLAKEVSGRLENKIKEFLLALEKLFADSNNIPMPGFKELIKPLSEK